MKLIHLHTGTRSSWLKITIDNRTIRFPVDYETVPRTASDAIAAALRPILATFEHNSDEWLTATLGEVLLHIKRSKRDYLFQILRMVDSFTFVHDPHLRDLPVK